MSASGEQESAYIVFTIEDSEHTRLNSQFWFFHRHVNDNRLIHNEDILLAPDAVVLEAATGTGIWSTELAKIVPPTVSIYSIDISTAFFPTSDTTPINVHFSQNSILSLPSEWSSYFDFASHKFLASALTVPQWRLAISEYARAIKPGGHVQLVEYSLGDGNLNVSLQALFRGLWEKHNLMQNISVDIPALLKETGFEDVKVEMRSIPIGNAFGEEGVKGIKVLINAFAALRPAIIKYNGLGIVNTEEEFGSLLESAEQEWMNGPGWDWKGLCVICATRKRV